MARPPRPRGVQKGFWREVAAGVSATDAAAAVGVSRAVGVPVVCSIGRCDDARVSSVSLRSPSKGLPRVTADPDDREEIAHLKR